MHAHVSYKCTLSTGRVLSSLPSNFLLTSIFLEITNPSWYVRAPSGKTKVSLLQRALVLQLSFSSHSVRSFFFCLFLSLLTLVFSLDRFAI